MNEKKFGFAPGKYFQKTVTEAVTEDVVGEKNFGLPTRAGEWLTKLITISLGMIFLGIPLFFTGLTTQGIAFEKQLYFYFWLLLALVGWAIKSVIIGEMKIRRTPLDIPILIFLVVYIVATIFSVDRWHSFWGFFGDPSRGLINIIALIVAYYLIVSNFSLRMAKWFFGALIASNFILDIWTILTIFGIKFLPQGILSLAPISLLGSFHAIVIFVSIMIPLLVAIAFKTGEIPDEKKVFRIISTGFLLTTLVLNFFLLATLYTYVLLAGWIAILIGLVLFLVLIFSRIIHPKSSLWLWLPIATFGVVMALFMIGRGINIAKINLPAEVNLNYSMTLAIAKNALKQDFFFGSGPATYLYDFSLYRPQDFNNNSLYNMRFFQGSSIIGEALLTIGVTGVFFLALLLILFVSVVGYLLVRDKNKDNFYSLGLVSAVAIFLIDALTLRLDGPILILGTLLGIVAFAAILREGDAQEKYLNLSLKSSPKYALALAFVFMMISAVAVFCFVFLIRAYVADVYSGTLLRNPQISVNSIQKISKAIDLNNHEAKYFSQLGQSYLVLANNEALKKDDKRDVNVIYSYLKNAIDAAVKSRDLMKNDVGAVESLAQVYENSFLYIPNALSLAEEQYKRAQELEPQNPLFFVKLGQIKVALALNEKDKTKKNELLEEAKNYFEQSIAKKNNFALGYFHLALANEALDNKDNAIENLRSAIAIDQKNTKYILNLGRIYVLRGQDVDLKNAEFLYKKVLEIGGDEFNARLHLGILYEKMNEKDKAIAEYQRFMDSLPEGNQETKNQVRKMIENVRQGIKNIPDDIEKINAN